MIPPDLAEWPSLVQQTATQFGAGLQAFIMLPLIRRLRRDFDPLLVQEAAGFHLGIGADIDQAARHSAQFFRDSYLAWLDSAHAPSDTPFRNQFFTVAVGGGNTLKNEYRALLRYYAGDIDWLDHVRFFLIEETCNAGKRESSRDCLRSPPGGWPGVPAGP